MRLLLVSLYHVEYAIEFAQAVAKNNRVHLVLSKARVIDTVGLKTVTTLGPNIDCSLLSYQSIFHPSVLKVLFGIFIIVFRFKPDVIHIQECLNPLNTAFFFLRNYPVIVTVHDVVAHPQEARRPNPRRKIFLFKINRKYSYQKVIVHGHMLKQLYAQIYKKSEQDIFVIPHGCLFSFIEGDTNPTMEEPHTVLFFGRIDRYKGLQYLIEAEPLVSDVLPDFKIVVAGRGTDLARYKSQIISNPHFEIHDRFIPNAEVASFFQRAAAVVLPYIEASQSGVIAMAYAFGKPVVASNVGSLGEVVKDGETGFLIPAENAERLAHHIIYLLNNNDKRKKMGEGALHLAKTTLSWENIASMAEKVYRTVAN